MKFTTFDMAVWGLFCMVMGVLISDAFYSLLYSWGF